MPRHLLGAGAGAPSQQSMNSFLDAAPVTEELAQWCIHTMVDILRKFVPPSSHAPPTNQAPTNTQTHKHNLKSISYAQGQFNGDRDKLRTALSLSVPPLLNELESTDARVSPFAILHSRSRNRAKPAKEGSSSGGGKDGSMANSGTGTLPSFRSGFGVSRFLGSF